MAGKFDRVCESVIGESTRDYKSEFGQHGYTVPEWVLELVNRGALRDTSWSNDAMPTFETTEDTGLRLWVDHRYQKEREFPEYNGRFTITTDEDETTEYNGDDPVETVQALLQSDYDEGRASSPGAYYVRVKGGDKRSWSPTFQSEAGAQRWIDELPKRMSREV